MGFGLIKLKWQSGWVTFGQGEAEASSFKALLQLQMQPQLTVMTMKISNGTTMMMKRAISKKQPKRFYQKLPKNEKLGKEISTHH